MRALVVLTMLTLWLGAPAPVHAYACPRRSLGERIARAEVIFVGRALARTRTVGPDLRTTALEVIAAHKGALEPGRRVTLRSCIGAKCGIGFERGRSYVVSAFRSAAGLHEQGACGLTAPIETELAQRVLAHLGASPLPHRLTAGLAWGFRHRLTRPTATTERHSFVCRRPALEFYVELARHPDPVRARSAFEALLARADHNTGLTYGWDWVALHGSQVIRAHAPCRFSAKNARRIFENARTAVLGERRPADVFECRCGDGCRRPSVRGGIDLRRRAD